MRKQGYNINPLVVNGNAVEDNAVATGAAQIGNNAIDSVFPAILHGDPFVVFGIADAPDFALVTKGSIKTVQQLNGKSLGLAGPTTETAALTRYTEGSGHIHINIVYSSSSSARAEALLAGRLDATPLEFDDLSKIFNGSKPGAFHILVNYATALPWLLNGVFFYSKSFEAAHPTIVQAFVNDVSKAQQQAYANPVGFVQEYGNLLSGYTPAELKSSIQQSAQYKIWPQNGALGAISQAAVTKSIAFYKDAAGLLTAAQAATLESTQSSWLKPLNPSS